MLIVLWAAQAMQTAAGFTFLFLLAKAGLPVKVLQVDGKRLVVLLPLHSARIEAELVGDGDQRVEVEGFYRARLEPGEVGTTQRNVLVIEIPEEEPARYRITRIVFEE